MKRTVLAAGLLALSLPAAAFEAWPSKRVAVLPLFPADKSSPEIGWALSHKILLRLPEERGLPVNWVALNRLIREHGLDKARILDVETLRIIGRLLSVDAVFFGKFKTQGSMEDIEARVVQVATGRLSQAHWVMAPDITAAPPDLLADKDAVPVPELAVAAPIIPDEEDLRDSVADWTCGQAAALVDELERKGLDLKARYWALRLKDGVSSAAIAHTPGSMISDEALKRQLYERIKQWQSRKEIPELNAFEVSEFRANEDKALGIARRCGIF